MQKSQNLTLRSTRKFFSKGALMCFVMLSSLTQMEAPAQANFFQALHDIFSPNSDLERAQGSRRGGSSRDICQLQQLDDSGGPVDDLEPLGLKEVSYRDVEQYFLLGRRALQKNGSLKTIASQKNESYTDEIKSIVAFVPAVSAPLPDPKKTDKSELLLVGKTVEEYPKLWLYVPFSADADTGAKLKFLMSNSLEEHVIEPIIFELPTTPGIVSITLPTSQPGLQYGEAYSWTVELRCMNQENEPLSQTVTGFITRAEHTRDIQTTADYIDHLEQGFWYDVVHHLFSSQQQSSYLSDFLSYFELGAVEPDVVGELVPEDIAQWVSSPASN